MMRRRGPAPGQQCLCWDPEDPVSVRVEKGNKAFDLREYELSAEIFRSVLPCVAQADRELCLSVAKAMARSSNFVQALGAFRGAALFQPLWPQELEHLVWGLANYVRVTEWDLPSLPPGSAPEEHYGGVRSAIPAVPSSATPRELFTCPYCRQLLHQPVTLPSGLTVCLRCVKPADKPPQARHVNQVLERLLQRCFPGAARVRQLTAEARTLHLQRRPEDALAKCQQALELLPGDIALILLRAELHLSMKNYEEALQDATVVCYSDCYFSKAHHVRAQILSEMGRSKEMLKELLYCLAINPDFTPAKKEAEKALYEMFFADSASVHPSPAAPPCQQQSSSNGLAHNNHTSSQASQAQDHNAGIYGVQYMEVSESEGNSSADSFLMSLTFEIEDYKAIESFLYIRPPSTALERQFPRGSKKVPHQNTLGETLKKDGESLAETIMDSEIGDCFSVDVTDLTCPHCMRLLFDPIVTSCGHTVCLRCLLCYFDEVPCCPLCREPLADLLENRKFITTRLTEELLRRYLPDALSDRKRIHEEELAALPNVTRNIPIFLETIAFPSIICPIYVSEFQYHVLITKCQEVGATRFAMCSPFENPGVGACGSLLEIKEHRIVPDGNPVVDTIGILRFRVLSYHHKNGLNTADLEHIEDKKVEGPEYAELVALHDAVYQQSVSWFTSHDDKTKEEIINYFGSMPDKEPDPQSNPSGPAWAWWVLQVLPVEEKSQLIILCLTSLKDRLLAIQSALVVCEEIRQKELGKISERSHRLSLSEGCWQPCLG